MMYIDKNKYKPWICVLSLASDAAPSSRKVVAFQRNFIVLWFLFHLHWYPPSFGCFLKVLKIKASDARLAKQVLHLGLSVFFWFLYILVVQHRVERLCSLQLYPSFHGANAFDVVWYALNTCNTIMWTSRISRRDFWEKQQARATGWTLSDPLFGWMDLKRRLKLHSIWFITWVLSLNGGTPKSSIWIECSIINHPFWGTPILGNTHILILTESF